MAVTLPLCFNLKTSITAGQNIVAVSQASTAAYAALCAELATPKHAFGTIYTASRSERVLVIGCDAAGLSLQRGFEASSAAPFPDNACFKIDTIVDGKVCDDDPYKDCPDIWSRLIVGKGLVLDRSDPDNPKLSIAETGVAAQEMCGATINACGQFTYLPQNWPASCMPTFQPCCGTGSGSGGGTVDACDVTFTPPFGSSIFTHDDVCGALEDLSTAITQIVNNTSAPVTSITAGNCISLSGPSTSPTINVNNTFAAGTYDGFSVNACGLITGYIPPTPVITPITGVAPISATYVAGTGYVVSIGVATVDDCGCVKLADAGDADKDLSTLPGDSVVTIDFLLQWAMAHGI